MSQNATLGRVLPGSKLESQYYQSEGWTKVRSDVPLVLFGGCLELKLPLLYPTHKGCDTTAAGESNVRRMVSFGTQHRYPSMRQVFRSVLAQAELLRGILDRQRAAARCKAQTSLA